MTSLDNAIHDARNAITVAESSNVVVDVPIDALRWLVVAAELYRDDVQSVST